MSIKQWIYSRNEVLVRLAAIATGIGCPGLLAATELTEEDILQDVSMVISATRLPQSVADSPVSITVLDRDLIESSGAIEIFDVLRLVPGMQIGLTWRDHHTAFSYHGQSDGLTRRMQVLIDGRVALSSQFGLTDWDRLGITVQDIERIEVVRGSAVASYGSHAYIGAINIITRDVSLAPTWQLSSSFGSENLNLISARYSSVGENLDYQLGLGYYQTDGFARSNDQVDAPFVRFNGRYQFDDHQSVDWQLGYGGGHGGRGGSEQGFPLVEPVDQVDFVEDYAVFRWNNVLSVENQWYLQFSYNASRVDDRNNHGQLIDFYPGGLPDGLENEAVLSGVIDLRADRTDIEFQQTLALAADSRLVWGAGVRQNRMKSFLTLPGNDYFADHSSRLFGNWERRYNNLLLNAGLIVENGDLISTEMSFRLGANYRLGDNYTVRASYAEGVRQAFVAEAFHELGLKTASGRLLDALLFVPEVPEPEKIKSYELGVVGNMAAVKVDFKLFREQLSNEIIETIDPFSPELLSVVTPGSIVRINGGFTTISGAEFGVDAKPWEDGRLWLAYSYATADQQSPLSAIRGQQVHSATPRHTASMSLSQQLSRDWSASLNYYYLDKIQWLFLGEPLDSYDRLDLRIAKSFQLGDADASVELIGQNVLGSSYSEFILRNIFDTRTFVRFSLKY